MLLLESSNQTLIYHLKKFLQGMRKYHKLRLFVIVLVIFFVLKKCLFLFNNSNNIVNNNDSSTQESIEQDLSETIQQQSKFEIYLDKSLNKNYYYYKYKTAYDEAEEIKIIKKNNKRKRDLNKRFYLILEYTKVFNLEKFCNQKIKNATFSNHLLYKSLFEASQKGEKSFDLLDDCVFKNCFFTCDKSLGRNADVVMFHETDLKNELVNKYQSNAQRIKENLRHITPLDERTSSKIWLLWNDEANGVENLFDNFQFNWTISYKSSSEVSYGAYGVFKQKHDDREIFLDNLKIEFEKRSNRIVWFNSNCQSRLRLEYAQALSLGYPLYVLGKCNEQMMANRQLTTDNTTCLRDSKCEMNLLSLNKFYLAFESKNCSDYITEKFWRSLSFGILPIVFQPAKKFYERIVPPNSFIHFEDFGFDAKRLIEYLKVVQSEFKVYKKYFEWKEKYNIVYDMKLEKIRMCEFCSKLNMESNEIYYKSVSKFFNNECFAN